MNEDKFPTKASDLTADFKKQFEDVAAVAEAASFWKDFWKEWIPGGLRKRKRYRTAGHGQRRKTRRRQNNAARIARRANRRTKKRRK